MRKSRKPKENFEGVSIKDSNFLFTEYRFDDIIYNFNRLYMMLYMSNFPYLQIMLNSAYVVRGDYK